MTIDELIKETAGHETLYYTPGDIEVVMQAAYQQGRVDGAKEIHKAVKDMMTTYEAQAGE